jgi:phytoene dehydrogenase-like protein
MQASIFDVVIVGSGINSLVCAALLGKKGLRVCVLERAETLGGCIRTEELTIPGFRHDTLSTLYPLFVSAPHFAMFKDELAEHGARFANTSTPTAVVVPRLGSLVFRSDRAANIAALEAIAPGDGQKLGEALAEVERHAPLTFGLLGSEIWRRQTAQLLARQAWTGGLHGVSAYFASAMTTCRDWLASTFSSELVRSLIAPWVLHVGLGPESATSALMAKLILFTLEAVGSPMVAGGSERIVAAFAAMIRKSGGVLATGVDVAQVRSSGKAGLQVITVDGGVFQARRAVVCNVTPTQLYGRLLEQSAVPPEIRALAAAYRYGRGEMQIHLALDSPPQWGHAQLGEVGMLHVTGGVDAVSKAVNESTRGLFPADASIVVAQPTAVDPSRAPAGKSILWIQLQEVPRAPIGDAAGELDCRSDGGWSEALREGYADRIVTRLCEQIPNLRDAIIARKVLAPPDLERLNINLVGGDPYSGSCEIDQFALWRPFAGLRDHETPVRNVFHIGASSHPGPGLGGMSGFMVANRIA